MSLEEAEGIIAPLESLPLTAEAHWQNDAPEPVFGDFQKWNARWQSAAEPERAALAAEGKMLAGARRRAMRELIRRDPRRALERAVPVAVRRSLPAEVAALLERPVDGAGALEVLAADAAGPGESAVSHRAVIGDERYRAYVYGRRAEQPTRRGIPLHGIALDGHLAVSEWPGRVLEAVEKAEALAADPTPPICPVSQKPAQFDGTEVALQVAETTEFFCGPPHAASSLRRRATLESLTPVGPDTAPVAASDGAGTPVANPSIQGNANWTTGEKRMLVVRLGFRSTMPDIFGPVDSDHELTTQDCVDIINATRGPLALWSYGELIIRPVGAGGSAVTPMVVLEDTWEDYSADDISEIWDEVDDEVEDLGYDRDDYDYLVVLAGDTPLKDDDGHFPTWGGLGRVGEGYSFIRRQSFPSLTQEERIEHDTSVILHELGHNFGLRHASSRYTEPVPVTDPIFGTVISIPGEEYGDIFDKMGDNQTREYSPAFKHWLRWLPDTAVPLATTSGTYTFREHDQVERSGRRGLSVPVVQGDLSGAHLVLDHRLAGPDNARLRSSVGVRLTSSTFSRNRTFLLDSTPETPMSLKDSNGFRPGTFDAPLLEGRTISWPPANPTVHVTNLDTDPESGLAKVQVHFGTFAGNHAPAGSITHSPVTAYDDEETTLIAAASDSDGDTLAYQWSVKFDNGSSSFSYFLSNTREQPFTFFLTGAWEVTCHVSDMKGKTTLLTRTVNVVANSTQPAITGLSDRTTPEDTMIQIPFTVSDGETPGAGITVTGGVYDPDGVITSAGFLLGSSGGGSRWVRLTPRPNQHGAALVYLLASDGGREVSKTFKITVTPTSGGPTPVASGSTWRYWAASGAPAAGWKNAGYDDGAWSQGASPFTHGETVTTGTNLPTAVPRLTTYYRRTFQGPLVFGEDTPILRVRADDGVVVYFNGAEIWRNNMPDGTPGHTTDAERSVEGQEELEWHVIPLPTLSVSPFVTHTIAAEVHDIGGGRGSGDVRFDLEFQRALGPVLPNLPNRVMPEDTTLTFTVSATDAETPGDTITFSGRSLHSGVPSDGVIFNGNQCSITPKLNAAGIVTIVISASDGSTATEDSFLLNITPVNDAPVLAPLNDVTSPTQQPVALVPVYISDVDHAATALTLTATSNNQALVANSSLSFLPDPDPANTGRRWLRLASPPQSVNDATLTVTLSDGAASVSRSFVFRSIFQTPVNTTPITIAGPGGEWSYWMEGTEQPEWTSSKFDDSRWRSGPAPLGYGLTETTTILATPLRITTYFRRKFTAPPDIAALGALTLKLQRDDGAVVFLDGQQIHRSNMPENKDGPLIVAEAEQTGADQTAWRSIVLPDSLTPGEHILAVEIHQASMPVSAATSDLFFDLALEAEPVPAALENKFILSPQLSAWRYHDGPNAPEETWAMPNYSDAEWPSGPAPLGFGTGLANTVVDGGPAGARYPVVCFRRTFDVADPAGFRFLHLMLQHDDGIRVFLNGVRLLTSNVNPDADLGTFAWSEIAAVEHDTWRHTIHPADRLVAGTNLLAVELHQYRATGHDLHFDLELVGVAPPGEPALALDRQPDGTWLAHWSAAYPGWNIERAPGLDTWSDQQSRAILRGARFELPEPHVSRHFYRLRK